MIRARAFLVLAFVAVFVPAVSAERVIAAESGSELRICVDPDNAPLSLNRVGSQPGFDVEIGQAIAERLELRARLIWVDTTYGGKALRRSLLAGKCDLFMGLPVDPAAETEGALTMTTPYYSTGYRLIAANVRSIAADAAADIRRVRIGVERQSGAHMRLEQIGSHLVVYGNQPQVLEAVARGEVDVGAIWLPDADRLIHGQTLTVHALANGAPDDRLRWNIAMGVRRADAGLRTSVNRVVRDLLDEGRIKAIFDQYGIPFFPPFTGR